MVMTLFIVVAIVFVCPVLFLAFKPIWHEARASALSLTALCVIIIAGLYYHFGRLDAINFQTPTPQQEISQALHELEQFVKQQPNNSEAQILLAQSLMQLGHFESAQIYFAQAQKLQPENVEIMVDYAESLFRATKPEQHDPHAELWIDKALSINPKHQRALFFKGILRLQAKQPGQAAAVWQKLLPSLDARTARALLPQINLARQQAGMSKLHIAPAKSLQITIAIDPKLNPLNMPSKVLFVIAKNPKQAGPPLAAKRIYISQFPLQVTLDASDSIMPTSKLFDQDEFVVSARIAASGSVQANSADWLSEPVLVQSDKLDPITLVLRHQP
jgi:cytochrome c-type biogenesis protein CcmH